MDRALEVVDVLLEALLLDFHLLHEADFVLIQILDSLLDHLGDLLRRPEDNPPLVQLILAEPVVKVLQNPIDIEAFLHIDLDLVHFSGQAGNVLPDVSQFLDIGGVLSDFVLDLLEFVENGLSLVPGSLGNHINEVLLEGLELLCQGLFHLFAVDLEERHLDLFGEFLPHYFLFFNNLGNLSLDLIHLPGVFLHLDVSGELIGVEFQEIQILIP